MPEQNAAVEGGGGGGWRIALKGWLAEWVEKGRVRVIREFKLNRGRDSKPSREIRTQI